MATTFNLYIPILKITLQDLNKEPFVNGLRRLKAFQTPEIIGLININGGSSSTPHPHIARILTQKRENRPKTGIVLRDEKSSVTPEPINEHTGHEGDLCAFYIILNY